MTPVSDPIAALVVGACALVLGALGALLFLRAGLPGGLRAAGIVGGLVVGVLAGPGVLGVFAPDTFERWALGATEEREALIDYDAETSARIVALREIGVSPIAITEERDQRAQGREALAEAIDRAESARAGAIDVVAQGALALLIVLSAPYWLPRERDEGARIGFAPIIGVLLTIGLVAVLVRAIAPDVPRAVELTIVALCATLISAPSARTPASLIPIVMGVFVVCYSLVRLLAFADVPLGSSPASGPIVLGPAVLLIALVSPFYQALPRPRVRVARRRAHAVAMGVLLPAACALVALRVDPHALAGDWVFWVLTLAIGLASSDLRWYALAVALRGLKRATPYTDAERSANAGGGVAQLLVALAALHAGVCDARLFAALAIGAALGEMTVALRTRVARAMQRGEPITEIFEPHDDDPHERG